MNPQEDVTPLSYKWTRSFDHEWPVALVSLFSFENMGARAMYSFLKQADYDARLVFLKEYANNRFDMPTEHERRLFIDLLNEQKVKLVGLSVRSPYFPFARDITEQIKKELGIPVVWGGTAATITSDLCVKAGADYVVCGEGEESFTELVSALATGAPTDKIANVWHMGPNGPVGNPVRPLISNLDGLPIPDLEDENKYYIENQKIESEDPYKYEVCYGVTTSRGCPFKCTYCTNSALHGIYAGRGVPFVRQRSVSNVIQELKLVKEKLPNVTTLSFGDEVFACKLSWLKEFSPEYKKEIGFPFDCAIDPRVITDEKIRLLKECGAGDVGMGIQCGSEKMRLELFERNTPDDKILDAANIINKHGLMGRYDIIADNPFETTEDKRATVDLLLKLPLPWILNLYSLNFFPRTKLAEIALEKGLITEDEISGNSERCLHQFMVSFDYERSNEDKAWYALYTLTSKSFVPKALTRWLSNRAFFMRHPKPLIMFARLASLLRLGVDGVRLFYEGRIDLKYALRFARSISSINR